MVSHQVGWPGLGEKASSNTCDHLRELAMFDLDDMKNQLNGSNGTHSRFHDDSHALMDAGFGGNGHASELRVDLAEILQNLHHWKVNQSEQNIQLISQLEQLSLALSSWLSKSPAETCFGLLELKCRNHAQNLPTYKDDPNRFLKLNAVKPSLYVDPPDVGIEERPLPLPRKMDQQVPVIRISTELADCSPKWKPQVTPQAFAADRSSDLHHQVSQPASSQQSNGQLSNGSGSFHRRRKKSCEDRSSLTSSGDRKTKNSQAAFMLNVAMHEDSDADLPNMYAGKSPFMRGSANVQIMRKSGCIGCIRAYSQMLLRTLSWDFFICFTIASYAGYLGFQVDWAVRNTGIQVPTEQIAIDFIYTFVFTVELCIRMIAESANFWSFHNSAFHWNYLDSFIVTMSLVESGYDAYWLWLRGSASDSRALGVDSRQLRIVRVLRTVRILKIFRIARLVRFVRALRTLLFSIVHTLKSVVWALVLLFFFIYVVAIVLTSAMSQHKQSDGCSSASLCQYWGDLRKAMLSLFSAVAGGISWYDIIYPLIQHLHPIWTVFFLAYVCFVYFAVLNVITGVFCESAIESAKADVEVAIRDALDKKEKYIKKLEKLFSWIDTDGSDEITLAELESFLTKELSGAFFEILELEVDYPDEVLRLIDTDRSGNISKDEFIDGVCRLRGPATALQIAQLGYSLTTQIEGLLSSQERGQSQRKQMRRTEAHLANFNAI